MAAIRETFFQECEEQLGALEAGLLAIEAGEADPDTVNGIFRAVHSIKGGAGAFKLAALVQFAHAFETTLDHVRSNRLPTDERVLKVLLRAADMLADLVRAARNGSEPDTARAAQLVEALSGLESGGGGKSGGDHAAAAAAAVDTAVDFAPIAISFDPLPIDLGEPAVAAEPSGFRITFRPTRELYAKGNETTLLLRELGRLGPVEVTCDAGNLPPFDDLVPDEAYLTWHIVLKADCPVASVNEVFEFVEGDCLLEVEALTQEQTPSAPALPDLDFAPMPSLVDAPAVAPVPAAPVAAPEPTRAPEAAPVAGAPAAPAAPVAPTAPAVAPPHPQQQQQRNEDAASAVQATIRVDLDRVDRLINLVGELVINQSMLSQHIHQASLQQAQGISAGLDAFGQLTREIQESVMAIRAQPLKSLFQRMSRIVREAADATGKAVTLRTEGEATEVDRTVIERLADPLTHMLRNAVDHGLETPAARLAAGKSERGEIRLVAAHRSGRVVIEVSDDGAGINRTKVKAVAEGKGLIAPDDPLTDSEVDNLIFLPGFSTADSVSSLSGRGVGMDVVKRSIQALGGRIAIASRPGRGSTFSLSLPLTLAVLDGMVVNAAGQTLVVPLTAIVETLKPQASNVRAFGTSAQLIADRDGFTPLVDVACELGYRSTRRHPTEGVVLMVETEDGARRGLVVDAIQDQRQVVIKSLEDNYGAVPGIAAATILGDGRIALILDVDAVVARPGRIGSLEPQFAA